MNVKEKKVELIELFYDLIYVYAISRLTMLIEEPKSGMIPLFGFFRYLVASFVILQAWLYLTNYVNRYGRWKWYEYALTVVNMTATVYMSNTISEQWNDMSLTFNLSMLVMLICVESMYFIQLRLKEQDIGAAKNMFLILAVDCALYFAAFLASLLNAGYLVLWLDAAAVFVGAFLPFFIRGNFDISIISFPHLTERFELITIITFGEAIVGMTEYFDVHHFSFKPIIVFAVLLGLFGSYVVQIHYLMEHKRTERALRLMFSHYFIVISLNLITVALNLIRIPETDRVFLAFMLSSAIIVFYISITANRKYYRQGVTFTKIDALKMCVPFLIGIPIVFIFRSNEYGVLTGVLLIAVSEFGILVCKHVKQTVNS